MNRLFRCLVVAGTVLAGLGMSAAHAQSISISGAVLKPGEYQWHEGARLRDAAVAGQVRADAWPLGAALLRQSAIEPQQRLKAGVLFDLRINKMYAQAENDPQLRELIERLEAFVEPLPVTGRVKAELNPFQLLVKSKNNLLEAGDKLLYPTRPNSVKVMGAVASDCELSFDAGLSIKDYLRECPTHPAADRNYLYIIQPDGAAERIGMAHWNQQQGHIAVGGILYVPLNPRDISPDTADLNDDIANFLATQYQLGGRYAE
ncbi:capsule biosynthesis GfcC family protein [Pseudomonas sp. MYb185]|uniref:capsule biosynthesis GfcC family protein n=1 Tax=Pseudomonas sp. MYb185 TaxID=1848729 RepID=UPI000CFDDB06|nr:capsule biosynthesis GfcC family protein [Pseudomonas sp. MYb185]PRB75452.1 hypothetical protein CQ007_18000 [Pseudomonas sp. MYb185]